MPYAFLGVVEGTLASFRDRAPPAPLPLTPGPGSVSEWTRRPLNHRHRPRPPAY